MENFKILRFLSVLRRARWEAKDLSYMQIPFDYTLRKKYSAR